MLLSAALYHCWVFAFVVIFYISFPLYSSASPSQTVTVEKKDKKESERSRGKHSSKMSSRKEESRKSRFAIPEFGDCLCSITVQLTVDIRSLSPSATYMC